MSVFRRREKRSKLGAAREMAWPRMGWRKTGKYWALRIKRLQGTPYSIACGFACGAAVSFTPLIGLHFVLAAAAAWLLRGHIIASAIGTAVGNPWTFPFIWSGILWLGTKILGYERGRELPEELTWSVLFSHPEEILLPMMVGGVPAALAVWVIVFFPIRRVVANYQAHRRLRRQQRKEVLAQQRQASLDATSANVSEDERARLEAEITIPEPRAMRSEEEHEMPSNVTRLDQAVVDRGR